jgi:adenosylcobinamide-GDP ribazoletransferase
MLRDAWREGKVALVFLTRLPLQSPESRDPAALGASAPLFPLVGALIGLAGGGIFLLATLAGLPPPLAAALALAAQIALTGGLHEDGLADVADGLGGGRTVEERLRIMRDPRIGAFGTIALVLGLLLRGGAIAEIAQPAQVAAALLAAGALSRAALPAAMAWLPPARSDGLGAGAGRPHPARAGASLLIAALLGALVLPAAPALLALALGLAAAAAMAKLAQRRIGGLTGDVLGAVQQIAEIVVLLVLVALVT